MASWPKEEITLDNGEKAMALAPYIISVSRSTDIPAFYADWLLYRMRERGYSAWTNPFNGARSYVSYANTRFIVFWSKEPRPLLTSGLLDDLEGKGIGCYVQYTLNDYEAEGLEKEVKPLPYRLETFRLLAGRLGKERVIWRFDPLILTDGIDEGKLLAKIREIGDQLRGWTDKLVFSFVDIEEYAKVRNNLRRNGIAYQTWDIKRMRTFAERLSLMNRERNWNYRLATCGERIDLQDSGISRNRCVDGDLITRIAWKDQRLMAFMKTNGKDAGQRPFCGCLMAKDIGEYNTCAHACVYCYANTNGEKARLNHKAHGLNKYAETITGR